MSFDPSFMWTAFLSLFQALPATLLITAVSVSAGLAIGTLVALSRIYRVPVLAQTAAAYVMFVRGTPMLMHLLLIYFGLPVLIDSLAEALGSTFNSASIPLTGFACIAFSLTAGAYMSEVVRASILGVDRGQLEAAHSIGMTTLQALRRIILPQALAIGLPNLSNSIIGMLHGSTLAYTISVVEINAQAQIVAADNWKYFEAYAAAALLFWGLTVLIERISTRLETRINRFQRGGAV